MTSLRAKKTYQKRMVVGRVLLALALALCLQSAYSFLCSFSDSDAFTKVFVQYETDALLHGSSFTKNKLKLPALRELPHYATKKPSYGFRIFDQNGKLLSSQNGELFSKIDFQRPTPNRGMPTWQATVPSRPFWTAGGNQKQVQGSSIYVEVVTIGDPELRRIGVLFVTPLASKILMYSIFSLLFSLIAFALIRNGAQQQLQENTFRQGLVPAQPRHQRTLSINSRQSAAQVVPEHGLPANVKLKSLHDASGILHEARTTLAIITLQLNKLPDQEVRRIEADVKDLTSQLDTVAKAIKEESHMSDVAQGDRKNSEMKRT